MGSLENTGAVIFSQTLSNGATAAATAFAGGDGTNDGNNDGGQIINQNGGVTTIFQTQTQTQTQTQFQSQFQTESIENTITDTVTARSESMNEISTLTVLSTVTTASSSEISPLTGTSTSSLSVATSNASQPGHHHLPGGEIAGIVIGACAGLILLFALVWLLLRRRLRSKVKDGSQSRVVKRWGDVTLTDPSTKQHGFRVEIERRELDEETGRGEFDAETERRELDPAAERRELVGQIPYRFREHLQEYGTPITRHELPGASFKERSVVDERSKRDLAGAQQKFGTYYVG
ncbi:hypothetical protein EV356DRAFT_527850 [Viridothelium virens]|uniref:Uncharacterized protein n=1 Tax=Viridothelium virens TaxID=1048519 RepID=A0A6A6HPH7_VIRVR|nr:hypothetical protein EV356DRAFT_527850 [Viridothelium virens]